MQFPKRKENEQNFTITKDGVEYKLPAHWSLTDSGSYTFRNKLQSRAFAHGSDAVGDGKFDGRTIQVVFSLEGVTEEDHDDVLANGVWQQLFTEKPEVLTREEKRAWLDTLKGVSLGSDAFFPFGDNIERAHKSGVDYIAQAGGSVRDDHVIETCDKYGIAMSFTGIRLFHH